MRQLFLVRHGETQWNVEEKTQGRQDSPLTAEGIQQGKMLANYLKKFNIDSIYCSPLKRAVDTGNLIREALGVPIQYKEDLMELNFGIWEGLTAKEIEASYPTELEIWHQHPQQWEIQKGESLTIGLQRVTRCIEEILAQDPAERILIISHGTIIKLYLMSLLGMELTHFYRLKQDNCALNQVVFKSRGPQLVRYNDTTYREIMLKGVEYGE